MKQFLLLIASVIISLSAYSQQVPDQFTGTVSFTDHEGTTHDINAYLNAGKYVIVEFFFTTCPHCQEEAPNIVQTYREMGCNEVDVVILGLECQGHDPDHDIDWFINEFDIPYPIVPLEGNAIISQLMNDWEIDGAPTIVAISPDMSMREMGRPLNYGDVVALGARRSACEDNWPIADFEADRTIIPAGESVMFSDLSTGAAEWNWTFYNGEPATSNVQIPAPVVYNTPGEYSVKLTIRNRQGNQADKTKTNYIKVIPPATEPPTAYFSASQVTVLVGNSVNFTDLSQGSPYIFNWTFEGAAPSTSSIQHPQNIRYNNTGYYNVMLIVENNLGSDTLLLEDYIHVIPDIGNDVPEAKFTCSNRLVRKNTPVFFNDSSTGYPMYWEWQFEGGTPNRAETQVIPEGIVYERAGKYDVTLAVSNNNGANVLRKQDYIVVYENYIGSYCDTISNLRNNEVVVKLGSHLLTSGYIGGHNSDHITTYADKYEFHTYNEISTIIIPILKLDYTNENEYITFYTWDGNDPVPTTVLSEQKVYLRDLAENHYQVINFAQPLKVDGLFYLGYKINYSSGTNVVIGLAPNRGYGSRNNTFFVQKAGEWYSTPEVYENINTSSGIKVFSCLVGIEDADFTSNVSIYPNPCSNRLIIENEYGFEEQDFIEIFDNLGRLVYSNANLTGNNVEINVSTFAIGNYIARIFTQGKVAVEKFEKLD